MKKLSVIFFLVAGKINKAEANRGKIRLIFERSKTPRKKGEDEREEGFLRIWYMEKRIGNWTIKSKMLKKGFNPSSL